METPRRDFLKLAAGAAALPVFAVTAEAAPAVPKSWDSKLMGPGEYVDVNGIRTHYFHAGQGEALVLIHGGQWPATSSADGWSSIFDHLTERYHVYSFDKLGMGFTDNSKSDADYSMEAIVKHAHGFIKARRHQESNRGGAIARRIAGGTYCNRRSQIGVSSCAVRQQCSGVRRYQDGRA